MKIYRIEGFEPNVQFQFLSQFNAILRGLIGKSLLRLNNMSFADDAVPFTLYYMNQYAAVLPAGYLLVVDS